MATATAASNSFEAFFETTLADADPEIFGAIRNELGRQRHEIELIASENIVSRAVLEAQGSIMTNKYAEGYPGKRYYGGCQFVDVAEELAIERAKKLFDCKFANVQPNSGSQMNQAVFLALLQPGDTFMGLDLNSGGHLTHGSPVNMSGKWFKVVSYGVRKDDHLLDMDEVERLAQEHKPKLILAGGTAYSRIWDWKRFREIADSIGAYLMVDMAHIAGLVAGGQHPSPLPHAHVVTTTTHKSLRGPRGGMVLTNDEDIAKKINSAVFPGLQGGPLMHVIAAKAVAFGEALKPEFKTYAANVVANAKALASSLKETGLDIVSGNAGVDIVGPWHSMTPEIVRTTLDINLIGVWNSVMASVPHIIEAGNGGSIILTSSANGLKAGPWNIAYNMSKFGVTGLTKSLAVELAKDGIRVNSVHPGGVDTPMAQGIMGVEDSGFTKGMEENPLLTGMLTQVIPGMMEPREISNAVLYLASDESKWVTGHALAVDGGVTQY
mgnify:CR=1 FL=1